MADRVETFGRVVTATGYALGVNWQQVEPYIEVIQYTVLALLLAVLVAFIVTRLRRRGEEKKAHPRPVDADPEAIS
ncbi:hypothetical protein ACIBBB_13830 [Streptomyces sp. NPDC051217]|uniref:hypothetical protein n=1 Tax=Streptomyces sp. NPDC051217 TaxID=3365644 RepID=UPI003795C0EB